MQRVIKGGRYWSFWNKFYTSTPSHRFTFHTHWDNKKSTWDSLLKVHWAFWHLIYFESVQFHASSHQKAFWSSFLGFFRRLNLRRILFYLMRQFSLIFWPIYAKLVFFYTTEKRRIERAEGILFRCISRLKTFLFSLPINAVFFI